MKTGSFYINLDRVPERSSFMLSEFKKIGLEGAKRFSAVDAKTEGALEDAGFKPGIGDRWALPKSAIACFESHRAVWKLAMDQGVDAVLIFEDDMVLSDELPVVLDVLFRRLSEFDLVKIDHSPGCVRFGPVSRIHGVDLRPILQRQVSAGAYVASRSGLEKLLLRSQAYGDTLDDFLYTPLNGWRMYQLFPSVAVQLMHLDIFAKQQPHISLNGSERELDPLINEADLPRGPAWFRLRKELRRLGRRLSWKFGGKAALERIGGYHGFIPMSKDLENL
jgi:hypothetical protein